MLSWVGAATRSHSGRSRWKRTHRGWPGWLGCLGCLGSLGKPAVSRLKEQKLPRKYLDVICTDRRAVYWWATKTHGKRLLRVSLFSLSNGIFGWRMRRAKVHRRANVLMAIDFGLVLCRTTVFSIALAHRFPCKVCGLFGADADDETPRPSRPG